MEMHQRAREAAMDVECKKDCARCGTAFGRHPKDSQTQWNKRRYCCKKCANLSAGKQRRSRQVISERFFKKVEFLTNLCWKWTGCRTKGGYGRTGFEGKTTGAHRLSWILHFGPIPDGLHVLHKCDNPSCIRPDHLFLGTFQDNMQDKVNKGRGSGPKGVLNPNAKLTGEKACQIFQRYQAGEQMKILASEFGVTAPCVHDICWGRTWTDFTGAERIR